MTPAITFLEQQRVPHEVRKYESVDEGKSTYGEAVAEAIGAEPDYVFKTLVAQLDSGELVVGVVPVNRSLDLGALASAAGAKKASMAKPEDAEKSTGYVTGGISPFGQRKRLRTFVDSTMPPYAQVFVSGGKRGLQIGIMPAELIRLTSAEVADLGR